MSELLYKFRRLLLEATCKIQAIEKYPDLAEKTDRWGNTRLFSKKVNAICANFEIQRQCDCCQEAQVECFPYIVYREIKIFSYPCPFVLGKSRNGGIKENDSWEEKMDMAGFSDELMNLISSHIENNPPGLNKLVVEAEEEE